MTRLDLPSGIWYNSIMGKLEFNWDGEELTITQCDKMKISPQICDTCEHRFKCFTERVKPSSAKVSSAKAPRLSDMLKEIQVKFESGEQHRTNNINGGGD